VANKDFIYDALNNKSELHLTLTVITARRVACKCSVLCDNSVRVFATICFYTSCTSDRLYSIREKIRFVQSFDAIMPWLLAK